MQARGQEGQDPFQSSGMRAETYGRMKAPVEEPIIHDQVGVVIRMHIGIR